MGCRRGRRRHRSGLKPFRDTDLIAAGEASAADGRRSATRRRARYIQDRADRARWARRTGAVEVGEHQPLLRGREPDRDRDDRAPDRGDLPACRCGSRPQGRPAGIYRSGRLVARGGIDLVVFLRDPLASHPHEPDIQALMKVCDVYCVPLATNVSTASLCLQSISAARGASREAA